MLPDLLALGRGEVAGDGVAGFDGCELRAYLLAEAFVSCGELAARMEGTAGWHVDQTRRRALDRQQPLAPRSLEARYRPSNPQV